jgi:hypothetical protein
LASRFTAKMLKRSAERVLMAEWLKDPTGASS